MVHHQSHTRWRGHTTMQESDDRTGLDRMCNLQKTDARMLVHGGNLGTEHVEHCTIASDAMCPVTPLQLPRLLPSNASMRLLMIWPFWKMSASTVDVHASTFVLCILLQEQGYSAMSMYYKEDLLCRQNVTCVHRLRSLLCESVNLYHRCSTRCCTALQICLCHRATYTVTPTTPARLHCS